MTTIVGEYYTNKNVKNIGFGTNAAKDVCFGVIANKSLLTASNSFGTIINQAGGASTLIYGLEASYLSIEYFRGRLSWKEYGRLMFNSVASNIAGIGTAAATVAGTAIGTSLRSGTMSTTFGGPIGTAIAVIFAGGMGAKYTADRCVEKYWPSEQTNQRKLCIEAARKQFLIPKDGFNDSTKFSKEILQSRYRILAKECHPDRKGGSKEIFQQLQVNLALLLALLENANNQK